MSEGSGRARILIADDDEAFAHMLEAMLTRYDYSCSRVPDARAAAEALAAEKFDLLIADIYMPGNEALQLLEVDITNPARVPIVLVTGRPSVTTAVDALRGGVVDYLTKPVGLEELLRVVENAIELGRAQRQAAQAVAAMQSLLPNPRGRSLLRSPAAAGGEAAPDASSPTPGAGPASAGPDQRAEDVLAALSAREREVAETFLESTDVQVVADTLGISLNTVRNHLKAIYRKLDVHSQLALFTKLRRSG